ncbi:hypothetical protein ACHHYP_02108 [Achlya hypogyna]|uniref:Uncharacterized protein n=1 Tax=Achlya hypogyna TaxID=1202772 RepID=A0A1V9Z7F5_ACHHY|nr:hypothetical protein ACHHYP_02108 [Achlya hypogyna]
MVGAKERKRNIVERKLRDIGVNAGRYQSTFKTRHIKIHKCLRIVSQQPWESLFMRKSRHERRVKTSSWFYFSLAHLGTFTHSNATHLHTFNAQSGVKPKKKPIRMSLMHRFIAFHNGAFDDREGFKRFCAIRLQVDEHSNQKKN